jgi:PAS domain S-box-containing protein
VLAHAPHPIWVKDLEGRYTLVNRAFELAFGVREAGVLGRTADEVLPMPFAARGRDADIAVVETGKSRVNEEAAELDGVGIEAVVVRFPIFDEAGAIVGVGGIATDVTRQMRARRQVHELQTQLQHNQRLQSLGALTNGIVHDFNNILLAISGYTELARRSLPEEAEPQAFLVEAQAAMDRARELIARLADFGRPEQAERQRLQLLPIVEEALRLLAVSAPVNVTIRGPRQSGAPDALAPEACAVLGDSTQLLQVVMNLCMNGLQSMPGGGRLEVRLEERLVPAAATSRACALQPGPHAVLSVADSGCGMDHQVVARIFDPYFTTKPRGQGSGLGLAVVRGIVEAHAGEIRVESFPGRGSRFEVWLPIEQVYSTANASR